MMGIPYSAGERLRRLCAEGTTQGLPAGIPLRLSFHVGRSKPFHTAENSHKATQASKEKRQQTRMAGPRLPAPQAVNALAVNPSPHAKKQPTRFVWAAFLVGVNGLEPLTSCV